MPAPDTLQIRTELHDQCLNYPLFAELVSTYARLQKSEPHWSLTNTEQMFGYKAFWHALLRSENFYVAHDMHMLAQHAAEDFPLDEAILPTDQPSSYGFMYLPARFREFELRGRLIIIHALLWDHEKLWCLTDRLDPEDEIGQQINTGIPIGEATAKLGRWDINMVARFRYNQPIPTSVRMPKGVLPVDAHVSWKREKGQLALVSDHAVDLTHGVAITEPLPIVRFLLAVWRLMQQTLSTVERQDRFPRALVRRARRFDVPLPVTVITLRRRQGRETGTGRPLEYRTITRGHWRRVWVGPVNGGPTERYQRAVYIHEYIRGPADAPLIIRPRVTQLAR